MDDRLFLRDVEPIDVDGWCFENRWHAHFPVAVVFPGIPVAALGWRFVEPWRN